MNDPAVEARVLRAAEIARQRGLTQSAIAAAVGASQPQVSRVLSGRGERASRLQEEICLYVERFAGGVSTEAIRDNHELMDALRSTWDGSAAHARALSTVIRSLAALGPKSTSDRETQK